MSQMAARDFEDMLQVSCIFNQWTLSYHLTDNAECAIPCFEGLLPSPDNEHVMSLLYVMAYWHGLAKMRMHVESSVRLLNDIYTVMGSHLRHFEQVVCPWYDTRETAKEHAKRIRAQTRITAKTMPRQTSITSATSSIDPSGTAPASIPLSTENTRTSRTGQKSRSFNLATIKAHLLGYCPRYIHLFGTLEMLSTMVVRVVLRCKLRMIIDTISTGRA